jgi:uncharacterized membrane protein
MTTLSVWKFDTETGAQDAARTLQHLARKGSVTVHDAASVVWPRGTSRPTTHQLTGLAAGEALGASFWGLLFGLVFYVPLLDAAIGAATSAFAGSLNDVGIDDTFMNKVRDQVTPGTSALFVLSPESSVEDVRVAFEGHRPADLVLTHLSGEQEAAIREVFAA